MLDLQGKVLQRTGKMGGDTRPFSNPTDIVLREQELLVLDTSGTRIQIMNLQCNLLRTVSLSDVSMSHDIAVAVDHDSNIYASFADASVITVYNHEGALLNSFEHSGIRTGEFNDSTGLWIDSTSCIFVADTGNLRVQVFQFATLNVRK